jgi:Uncharacterized protein conserved in bacteria
MNPQATPAPIHDITGPVAFSPQSALLVVGIVAGIAVLSFLIWFFFLRDRRKFVPSPFQVACAELEKLRPQIGSVEPYAFAVKVSDVLRTYLQAGRGLPAGSQTSMEFLETVRARNAFNDDERAALAAFLEKADLIKFARWHATSADCSGLLDAADRLVRSQPQPEEVTR